MGHPPDLSPYCYCRDDLRAKNVGWLQRGCEFDTMVPSEDTLDLLWSFCSISVMQSRGIHECDLCATPQTVHAARNGVRLLLGTSEIRVFSGESGTSTRRRRIRGIEPSGLLFLRSPTVSFSIFAAPTLIYHYVRTHHYKPPDEFLRALKGDPRPPSQEYFEHLRKLNLEWIKTSSPSANPSRVRFTKIGGEIQRVEEPHPVYLDES